MESLPLADLDFEGSDDVLSNMPSRDYCTNGIDNFYGAIFPNYTIPFWGGETKDPGNEVGRKLEANSCIRES